MPSWSCVWWWRRQCPEPLAISAACSAAVIHGRWRCVLVGVVGLLRIRLLRVGLLRIWPLRVGGLWRVCGLWRVHRWRRVYRRRSECAAQHATDESAQSCSPWPSPTPWPRAGRRTAARATTRGWLRRDRSSEPDGERRCQSRQRQRTCGHMEHHGHSPAGSRCTTERSRLSIAAAGISGASLPHS